VRPFTPQAAWPSTTSPSTVLVGRAEGLPKPCVANLDNLHAVATTRLRIGTLAPRRSAEVARALGYALDIDRLKDS
jgi:mRNA-degrading endonuclease toxin of MazEF toxin-antitoxin module